MVSIYLNIRGDLLNPLFLATPVRNGRTKNRTRTGARGGGRKVRRKIGFLIRKKTSSLLSNDSVCYQCITKLTLLEGFGLMHL